MTEPQTDSSKKKPIMFATLGVVSLIITAFAANFILQGMKETKIEEQERQATIQAEEERQATIRRRQTVEENEEDLTAVEAEKAEKEPALKAEAEGKEQNAIEAEKEAALKAALEAPRPWQLEVKVKSSSNDLENVIRGEK